jgi:hypothetical protein
MTVLARYLIALVICFHGLVYVIFALYSPYLGSLGWRGSSLLLGNSIVGQTLKMLTIDLWAVAGVGLIATGITIAFISFFRRFWRPLAIGASLVSILSLWVFWDGQQSSFSSQGGIGMIVSLAILTAAIVLPTFLSRSSMGRVGLKKESRVEINREAGTA